MTLFGTSGDSASAPLWYYSPHEHFRRDPRPADYVKVKGASLENGLLHVDLVREIPEAMKPRSIPIASSSKLLEVKPTKVAALRPMAVEFWERPGFRGVLISARSRRAGFKPLTRQLHTVVILTTLWPDTNYTRLPRRHRPFRVCGGGVEGLNKITYASYRLTRRSKCEIYARMSGSLVADPSVLTSLGWTPPVATPAGLSKLMQAGAG
jgi:hypothetical protein